MILIVLCQFAMGCVAIGLRFCTLTKCGRGFTVLWQCFSRTIWFLGCCGCFPLVLLKGMCWLCLRCCIADNGPPELSPRGREPSADSGTVESGTIFRDEEEEEDASVSALFAGNSAVSRPAASSRRDRPSICSCCASFLAFPRRVLRWLYLLPGLLAKHVRWYWFHLSGQVGFMAREIIVINRLDGWYWEVCAANVAMWLVIIMATRQIWQFSYVRNSAPKAIDQILDMLLLPVNYGFLCALCVRILKLENTDQNRMIVLAMIDSADVWESWALWSVLKLFVKVVEKDSELMVRRETREKHQQLAKAKTAAQRAVRDAGKSSSQRHSAPGPAFAVVAAAATPLGLVNDFGTAPSSREAEDRRLSPTAAQGRPRQEAKLVAKVVVKHAFRCAAGRLAQAEKRAGSPETVPRTPPAKIAVERAGAPAPRLHWDCNPAATAEEVVCLSHTSWPTSPADSEPIEVASWLQEVGHNRNNSARQSSETSRQLSRQLSFERQGSRFSRQVSFDERAELLFASSARTHSSQSFHGTTGSRYLEVVLAFKKLSLSGVQAWVYILVITNTLEILVKGIIGPSVPTLCFFIYGECTNCSEWYNLHVYAVSQGIIYILCTFALIFVVAFERVFQDYLHKIEPYWKFWGVKCVVSVTYFQWLVFKYVIQLDDQRIYLWHSLVCCIEMPLLCIMHATYAYPFGKDWVDALLGEMPAQQGARTPPLPPPSDEVNKSCLWWFLRGLVCLGCCLLSVKIILWVLPPEYDTRGQAPITNITCSDQGLGKYIDSKRESMHWSLPGSMRHRPAMPLCTNAEVGCALGYSGRPTVYCMASGRYREEGQCQLVGCGPPLKLDHAKPRLNSTQERNSRGRLVDSRVQKLENWTSRAGMRVFYDCDLGYRGSAYADCGDDGHWLSHGECQIVGCGSLGGFLERVEGPAWWDIMDMQGNSDLTRSHVGEVVQFMCTPGYRGQPVATCVLGGNWSLADRCRPFATSRGCSCRREWLLCTGLFNTNCQKWYGCNRADAEPYAWCKVAAGSCPRAAHDMWGNEPPWDYCVSSNFQNAWPPRPVPNIGVVPSTDQVSSGVFFLCMFLISFSCFCRIMREFLSCCCMSTPVLRKAFTEASRRAQRIPGATRRAWLIVSWHSYIRWVDTLEALARLRQTAAAMLDAQRLRVQAALSAAELAMQERLAALDALRRDGLAAVRQRHVRVRSGASSFNAEFQRSTSEIGVEVQRWGGEALLVVARRRSQVTEALGRGWSSARGLLQSSFEVARQGPRRQLQKLWEKFVSLASLGSGDRLKRQFHDMREKFSSFASRGRNGSWPESPSTCSGEEWSNKLDEPFLSGEGGPPSAAPLGMTATTSSLLPLSRPRLATDPGSAADPVPGVLTSPELAVEEGASESTWSGWDLLPFASWWGPSLWAPATQAEPALSPRPPSPDVVRCRSASAPAVVEPATTP